MVMIIYLCYNLFEKEKLCEGCQKSGIRFKFNLNYTGIVFHKKVTCTCILIIFSSISSRLEEFTNRLVKRFEEVPQTPTEPIVFRVWYQLTKKNLFLKFDMGWLKTLVQK